MREATLAALGAVLILGPLACVLPMRSAPGAEGRVVDRETGRPLEGAIVVVRFDGRYGDALPDRDHLGHAETRTDAAGRFRVEPYSRAGLVVWPFFRAEARVVGVMRAGYRCPAPVPATRNVQIRLAPAQDMDDRRQSCRPVGARRGEADEYIAAWRSLFPPEETPEQREERQQLGRLLEARAVLGFGENCEGPVHDLAMAPDGTRAAYVADLAEDSFVHMVELSDDGSGVPQRVAPADDTLSRRLAWTGPEELVLWQPSSDADRAVSPSVFAPGRSELVWTSSPALPASLGSGTADAAQADGPRRPLDPEDLSDEADIRWLGRSFALDRSIHPATGLSQDRLSVTRADGSRYVIDLPGEACGGARFGRPHYRIAAGGRVALDLRWVKGGCHAVQIDLENGDWELVDRAREKGVCQEQRRVPPAQLSAGVRGWTRELHVAFERAGADPGAAYTLRIEPDGATQVHGRDLAGGKKSFHAPRFPIETPLRRIDVTNVAPATRGSRAVPRHREPVMEPL